MENMQKQMDAQIARIDESGEKPTLLLHSCCAPCSSAVLAYLAPHFDISIFYYNPNISPAAEYAYRLSEQERLVKAMGLSIPVLAGDYRPQDFFDIAAGLEALPEGGERCRRCFALRLNAAAACAAARGSAYFATTLTVSPHKNASDVNEAGLRAAALHGARYLPSDFKKKDGYKRSIELSHTYHLYRQNYCGCIFSKQNAEKQCNEIAPPASKIEIERDVRQLT